jgi:murein DD-endopeptidase MepM/ murein hydrolase activator NlpD
MGNAIEELLSKMNFAWGKSQGTENFDMDIPSMDPRDLIDDRMAPYRANIRQLVRAKALDISQPFDGYAITAAFPLHPDRAAALNWGVFGRFRSDSEAFPKACYVRIPILHDKILPNPFEAGDKTLSDALTLLHVLAFIDPSQENLELVDLLSPVSIIFTDKNFMYAKILKGAVSPNPNFAPPVSPQVAFAEAAGSVIMEDLFLGDEGYIENSGLCDDLGIYGLPPEEISDYAASVAGTKHSDVGKAYHAMLDFFPDAKLPCPPVAPINSVAACPRINPLTHEPKSPHEGTDLGTGTGTDVFAAAGGIVKQATQPDPDSTQLSLISIYHPNTALPAAAQENFGSPQALYTRYLHLSEVFVEPGQLVSAGHPIGKTGGAKGAPGSGGSTGPHLHYEIKFGHGDWMGFGGSSITLPGFRKAENPNTSLPHCNGYPAQVGIAHLLLLGEEPA